MNGWVFTLDQNKIYDFLIQLASHKLVSKSKDKILHDTDQEVIYTAKWIQQNMRKIHRAEYPLQFRQLRDILNNFSCEFELPKRGRSIKIHHGKLKTKIPYGSEGSEIAMSTIHKLRKELQLDEAHGYDSHIFYNKGKRIPEFINKYRQVLDRLAKV
jgi:death-on-curing protein